MQSLTSKLKKLNTALTAVTSKSYHYTKPASVKAPYVIWTEESEDGSFHADNAEKEQEVVGYIDLYTLKEFDPLIDVVQGALARLDGCAWRLSTVQYEDETKLIHYTWEWRLV